MNAEQLQSGVAGKDTDDGIGYITAGLESTLVNLDVLFKCHNNLESTGSVTRAEAEWLAGIDEDALTVSLESFTTVPSRVGVDNFKESIDNAWVNMVAKRQNYLARCVEVLQGQCLGVDLSRLAARIAPVNRMARLSSPITDLVGGSQIAVADIPLAPEACKNYYLNNPDFEQGSEVIKSLLRGNDEFDITSLVYRFYGAVSETGIDVVALLHSNVIKKDKIYPLADAVFGVRTSNNDYEYTIGHLSTFLECLNKLYTVVRETAIEIASRNIDETSALFHINSTEYDRLSKCLGLLASADRLFAYILEG